MADLELTDFQRKKILKVFSTFFDINNDGVIEWEDFEICVHKIGEMHGWEIGTEKHTAAMDTLKLIWDGLKKFADENNDEKITREEWLKMWQDCVKDQGSVTDLPEWQQRYMDFMFEVNDTSGDQKIDQEEYTMVFSTYGLSNEECEQCFTKFAENGMVSRELYKSLWVEYFTSTDPAAKGNFIFGNPDNF